MAHKNQWLQNAHHQLPTEDEEEDLLVDFRPPTSVNRIQTTKQSSVDLPNGHKLDQDIDTLVNCQNVRFFAGLQAKHTRKANKLNKGQQDEKEEEDDEEEEEDNDDDDDEEFNSNERRPLMSTSKTTSFELKQRSQNQRLPATKLLNNGNKNSSLQQTQRTNHILYEIRPGDTLLSISLACQCTLEELKRINGLMREQEFFGLRYLKIPAWKLGVFSEALQNNGHLVNSNIGSNGGNGDINPLMISNKLIVSSLSHSNSSASIFDQSSNNETNSQYSKDLPMVVNQIGATIASNCTQPGNPIPGQAASLIIDVGSKHNFPLSVSSPSLTTMANAADSQSPPTDPKSFLNSLDQSVEQIRKQTTALQQQSGFASGTFASDFNAHLSNEFAFQGTSHTVQTNNNNTNAFNCDGADCGLRWTEIVCIALFVCVLGPLIYTLIWAEERIAENQIHHHMTDD